MNTKQIEGSLKNLDGQSQKSKKKDKDGKKRVISTKTYIRLRHTY